MDKTFIAVRKTIPYVQYPGLLHAQLSVVGSFAFDENGKSLNRPPVVSS